MYSQPFIAKDENCYQSSHPVFRKLGTPTVGVKYPGEIWLSMA
jgi:hypothetical protein